MKEKELVRIQKYISDAGVMSRRAAEKEITLGNITVNGVVSKLGDKIDPSSDALMWKNMPITVQTKKYYVLLNKPTGYITSTKDEFGRKTVNELLSDIPARLYPVGRLDATSEGALICTNDGTFANKVIHPSSSHDKVYHVFVQGKISAQQISELENIRRLKTDNGYEKIRPVSVKRIRGYDTHTILEFVLSEGKNRQIRRMCQACGVKIMQLKRISVGKVFLGDLPCGKYRFLTSDEIKSFNA